MEKREFQKNKNQVRATGVVRIVRRAQAFRLDLSDPCIERTCIERTCMTCGKAVTLTLEQAGQIPPDQTDCAECFRKLINEGFEELKRRGIILSTICQNPVD